jgi:intracellular sulfur oxidation DsrE/DsrF family protein
MKKYRVVFHLDEPSKGRADQVFRNNENLLDDLGENNVEAELVANGEGVNALVKGPDSHVEQVGRLAARGVLFAACAHSSSQLEIAREELLDRPGSSHPA